mgnify:CR=1 FL=1
MTVGQTPGAEVSAPGTYVLQPKRSSCRRAKGEPVHAKATSHTWIVAARSTRLDILPAPSLSTTSTPSSLAMMLSGLGRPSAHARYSSVRASYQAIAPLPYVWTWCAEAQGRVDVG